MKDNEIFFVSHFTKTLHRVLATLAICSLVVNASCKDSGSSDSGSPAAPAADRTDENEDSDTEISDSDTTGPVLLASGQIAFDPLTTMKPIDVKKYKSFFVGLKSAGAGSGSIECRHNYLQPPNQIAYVTVQFQRGQSWYPEGASLYALSGQNNTFEKKGDSVRLLVIPSWQNVISCAGSVGYEIYGEL